MKINRRQALLLVLARHRIKKRKEALEKKKRRFWVRRIFEERKTKGEFHTLVADMKLFDHEYFQKQFRMSPTKLEELLRWVAPRIIKKSEKRETNCPRGTFVRHPTVFSHWGCTSNHRQQLSHQPDVNRKNNKGDNRGYLGCAA